MTTGANDSVRVLVFGATGVAGGGVIAACLEDPRVTEIVAVTRRPLAVEPPPKVRSVLCRDFADLRAIEPQIAGVDAVYYCLGVSASQVGGEAEYREITERYALAAARAVSATSRGATFHFVSGSGTNAKSRMMWARVKGETELALASLTLGGLVCWRPGMILTERAPEGRSAVYRALHPLTRLARFVPAMSIDAVALGRAMLQLTFEGRRAGTLENRAIREAAERYASSTRSTSTSASRGNTPGEPPVASP